MEYIEKRKDVLLSLFQVRRTAAQKADFRAWLMAELKRSGWKAHEETYGKFNGSVNVVAGEPGKALVYLVAHYDTAARMLVPNFVAPTNPLAHVGYHFLTALLLLAAALVVSFAVTFPLNLPKLTLPLFLLLALALLFTSVYGPANRSNANGNTSGVLALLAMADRLPRDKRVCFVFLDNSERNFLGASSFKKQHITQVENCLFLNFDCVGDGEDLLMMPSKLCRWDADLLAALEESFPADGKPRGKLVTQGLVYYPSDHKKFKFHVAFAACKRRRGIGYYIPHLRTRRDTALSLENVDTLVNGMERFLPRYLDHPVDEAQKKGDANE